MKKIPQKQKEMIFDPVFLKKFFKKNVKKYFPKTKILSLGQKINKNTFNKNFLLTYVLELEKNGRKFKKKIKGKSMVEVDNIFESPRRAYLVSKHLWVHGFENTIPRPLDYIKKLNLFLYEETAGESLEKQISRGKIKSFIKFSPEIGKILKKLHQIKIKIEPSRRKILSKKQNQSYLSLVKKFNPKKYQKFKKYLVATENLKRKKSRIFLSPRNFALTHGDFHPGNVLIDKNRIKFLDFGSAGLNEPLSDVGNFFMQTELMLRPAFSAPRHLPIAAKIRENFIKTYFGDKLTDEEKFKLLYFEIKCLTQVIAIISLFQKKNSLEQNKSTSAFFKILDERFRQIKKISKIIK